MWIRPIGNANSLTHSKHCTYNTTYIHKYICMYISIGCALLPFRSAKCVYPVNAVEFFGFCECLSSDFAPSIPKSKTTRPQQFAYVYVSHVCACLCVRVCEFVYTAHYHRVAVAALTHKRFRAHRCNLASIKTSADDPLRQPVRVQFSCNRCWRTVPIQKCSPNV